MNKHQLKELKERIIITDPEDIILTTRIANHPSLGKPDEVVWKYSYVVDDIKMRANKD